MSFPEDQIQELKRLFPGVSRGEEGGVPYFLLPGLVLPQGCQPVQIDALLCPVKRDGYSSRLFFAERIQEKSGRNWNANGVRILEQNWHAFSWKTPENLRLAQMVAIHLKGLP